MKRVALPLRSSTRRRNRSRRSRGRDRRTRGLADEAHGLGRLERARARRLQASGRRVRQAASRRHARTWSGISTTRRSSPRFAPGRRRTWSARSTPTTSASTAARAAGSTSRRTWRSRTSTRRSSRRRRSTTRSTTASGARCRCSPTPTASTTTRRSSRRPGISAPPTIDRELTADAKKLTVRNKDGSFKVRSASTRSIGFYENVPERWVTAFGGKWIDAQGPLDPLEVAGLGEVAHVAEEPDRLVRLQEPRASSRPASATSSPRRTRSRSARSP